MNRTITLLLAGLLFIVPALETARWIYVAEHTGTFKEARARYFEPYPAALQDNTISTWIFFLCLTLAAVIFIANRKRGVFFLITGIFSAILAFWMLFSLM
jgi:hypothetical protein